MGAERRRHRPSPSARRTGRRTLVLIAACALVAACDGGWPHFGSSRPPAALAHRPTAPAAAGAPSPDADMVAAVASTRSDGIVQVRFALRKRPEVGAPAELDVELVPATPLDRLVATFHGEDGLALREGGDPAEFDRPETGVPISHPLEIVAQHDGIFYIHTTVLADSGAESIARTFTIPIIAGSGTP
ncbi:MAG TPA: hypothetical protein VMU67_08840 [Steroidobacteraceae bacterium]|nr:hypothetical protein [Steroidobacteraceae bacterium]